MSTKSITLFLSCLLVAGCQEKQETPQIPVVNVGPRPSTVKGMAYDSAERYNVEPKLFWAICVHEHRGEKDPKRALNFNLPVLRKTSNRLLDDPIERLIQAADFGPCQLNGKTARSYRMSDEELRDERVTIDACAFTFGWCQQNAPSRKENTRKMQALSCYNTGKFDSVQGWAWATEVMQIYRSLN